MKRSSIRGFTLVEMLTVMVVIAILAGLVLAVNAGIQYKAAKARAEGEMAALSAACESYKADNGGYPRDSENTDALDARTEAIPLKYKKACLVLYSALSGDLNCDFLADKDAKVYYEFKPEMLNYQKKDGKMDRVPQTIKYIQDPWGNCYGYSTANAKQEEEYLVKLKANTGTKAPDRPATVKGYNPTYDLWSTGGSISSVKDQNTKTFRDAPKWVKNW